MKRIALVSVAVFIILLASQFISSFSQKTGFWIDPNQVRGSAIVYKQKPFTLNFTQQNLLIEALNHAQPFEKKSQIEKTIAIEEIILYQFDRPDLKFLPVAYRNNNLIFMLPNGAYAIETSNGKLKTQLSQAYDP